MLKVKRLFRSIFRLVLPVVVLVLVAGASASIWLVHTSARLQPNSYLVTPAKYGLLSARGAQVTDEKWPNHDGTMARGWLLRGAENSPAVVLLHKYGADRSYELNLGVKLSEATNFTILMPDLRGHGEVPLVQNSTFGQNESEDTLAALEYLRSLKTPDGVPLVGSKIGMYGVELGALAALRAASKDRGIAALALDSVPADSGAVISNAVGHRYPFGSAVTSKLAGFGAPIYFYKDSYSDVAICDTAKTIGDRHFLLLAGLDETDFQASTTKLGRCIQSVGANVEARYDLSPSGYNIMTASMDKSQDYEQRIIDFFRLSLAAQDIYQ